MEILIISGLSGAGKSRVAAALEDLDFYCVDNMPVSLIPRFAELCAATRGRYERVALVTDVRNREGFDELFAALDELKAGGFAYKILYVTASTETLVRRFKETRRRHPLSGDGTTLLEAVQKERDLLAAMRQRADYTIDTTGLTLGRLQRILFRSFGAGGEEKLRVTVMSFGYKHGLPIDADIVFDVRFLPNPFYVEALKDRTGLDPEVRDYVFKDGEARAFLERFEALLSALLPHYEEEGKLTLTIAIGCTGGHHRSVAVSEALCAAFTQKGYPSECVHRDIER